MISSYWPSQFWLPDILPKSNQFPIHFSSLHELSISEHLALQSLYLTAWMLAGWALLTENDPGGSVHSRKVSPRRICSANGRGFHVGSPKQCELVEALIPKILGYMLLLKRSGLAFIALNPFSNISISYTTSIAFSLLTPCSVKIHQGPPSCLHSS